MIVVFFCISSLLIMLLILFLFVIYLTIKLSNLKVVDTSINNCKMYTKEDLNKINDTF